MPVARIRSPQVSIWRASSRRGEHREPEISPLAPDGSGGEGTDSGNVDAIYLAILANRVAEEDPMSRHAGNFTRGVLAGAVYLAGSSFSAMAQGAPPGRDCLGGDVGRRAWPVLDHDGIAELLAEALGDHPRKGVDAATGGESDDEGDLPVRIFRRLCECRLRASERNKAERRGNPDPVRRASARGSRCVSS
jgi:hypothetical protein